MTTAENATGLAGTAGNAGGYTGGKGWRARGRVLIVEPDEACALVLMSALGEEGYEVSAAGTAAEARSRLGEADPRLVITELALPDADGLLLCADLKRRTDAPVMVCTTQNDKQSRMLSFRLGAEDFIAKPYDLDEVLVRVDAVMRRAAERAALHAAAREAARQVPAVGGLTLNRLLSQASYNGQRLALTPAEYRILAVLMTRPNVPVSRQELARLALGYQHVDGTRGVDMHVRRLRAKLAAAGVNGVLLASVRGTGYRLIGDARRGSVVAA